MRRWAFTVGVLAMAMATAAVVLGWRANDAAERSAPPREIVLVARGMAFYLAEDPRTPNPTLRLRAGERVRVVLRNEERGISHSFAVPGWRVETRLLEGTGSDTIDLAVPGAPGRQDYRCTPHAAMMRGTIEIR